MVQTYSVTSEPSAEPVAMSVLKARLRVTASEFDDEIASLLEASRRMVEAETSRCFVTQTLKFTADAFPSARSLELRRLPVASVSSVQYVDTSRATQTLSADAYTLDLSSSPARVVLLPGQVWPATSSDCPQAVTVTFVAGVAAADVSPVAVLAIVEQVRLRFAMLQPERVVPENSMQIAEKRYRQLVSHLAWTGVVPPAT